MPSITRAPRPAARDLSLREMRVAARRLLREASFTLIVVSTLALGIGAATTIFSVVHGVLLRPLPYRDADRVVTLWQWNQPKGIDEAPSPANFLDWRDGSRLIDLATAEPYGFDLTGSGDSISLGAWRVSEGFIDVLGIAPALGRTFVPEEHHTGTDRVVLLSDRLWRTRFGGDPRIVGRTLTLDRESFRVVGVMPRVDYPSQRDIWIPKVFSESDRRARARTYYQVIGRLKPGVTLSQAREEMRAIGDRLAEAYPRANKGVGVTVDALFDRVTGPVRRLLLLLLVAVGCLLFVACANAANLMLARAASRHVELAVRRALGAGRLQLLRLTLAESVLLTLAAAAVGVITSYWAVTAIVALAPADVPRIDEVRLDVGVLGFAIVVAAATALVCGLAPALHVGSDGCESSLRSSGRSLAGGGRGFSRLLVGSQTAAAMVLLIGSGLLVRSFDALLKVDLGYRVDNRAALTMHVWDFYPTAERRASFMDEAERRLAQQPGVVAVGAASALPLSREGSEMDPPYTVIGRPAPSPGDEPTALATFITRGYFTAIGMRLVQGRLFSERDTAASPAVVVVNETMARRAWPGENPVGKRIRSGLSFAGVAVREVVGVVGDVRQAGLQDRPQPAYYVPHQQVPFGSMTFIVLTAGDPARVVPSLQRAIWSLNPAITFAGIETLNGLLRDTLAARRFALTLLSGFALVAVVLASVGLYGLVSFSVSERAAEIGIRLALGARAESVIGLVMRQGMAIACAGLFGGVIVALALTRYLAATLFGVTATDPVTFTALTVAVASVSAVACYVPARRATRVDPLIAMRV